MLPSQEAHDRSEGTSVEGGTCAVEHNLEWVAVDLSTESSGSNGLDPCTLKLNVLSLRLNDSSTKDDTPIVIEVKGAPHLLTEDVNTAETGQQWQQLEHHIITLQTNVKDDEPIKHGPLPNVAFVSPHSNGCAVKVPEAASEGANTAAVPRTVSAISTDSLAEYCRICQQPTDEPLIELGCHCRGELSKAHRTCIQQWFSNKGSNKCEVCRQVATNLPAPATQPLHNFWAWRMNGSHGRRPFQRWQRTGQFHPLLAALLILVAGLLFDILISYYLGASALPVNIIIGVLVVLGLGTAGRLIIECCRDRSMRRRIRRLEMAADMDHLQTDNPIQ